MASVLPVEAEVDADDHSNNNGNSEPPTRVWWLPWTVFFVMIYVFAVFWVDYAIIQRYIINGNWDAALPGLGSTTLRKVTMGGHMTCGAVSLLVGPFQFIPVVRRKCPGCHRWSGRIYMVCALLSSFLGISFILLKGKLVGGWNMSWAFFCGGITNAIVAYQTWKSARAAKMSVIIGHQETQSTRLGEKIDNPGSHSFVHHRNWGIRSYSQILSPMLYRYWYVTVSLLDLYRVPVTPERGGVCLADDTCPDYARPFDQLHCWTYWLSSLLVAELLIYFLPTTTTAPTLTKQQRGDVELCRMDIPTDQSEALLIHDNDSAVSSNRYDKSTHPSSHDGTYDNLQDDDVPLDDHPVSPSSASSSAWTVNLIATTLAIITTAITVMTMLS